jgi:hypothetical protein
MHKKLKAEELKAIVQQDLENRRTKTLNSILSKAKLGTSPAGVRRRRWRLRPKACWLPHSGSRGQPPVYAFQPLRPARCSRHRRAESARA